MWPSGVIQREVPSESQGAHLPSGNCDLKVGTATGKHQASKVAEIRPSNKVTFPFSHLFS